MEEVKEELGTETIVVEEENTEVELPEEMAEELSNGKGEDENE